MEPLSVDVDMVPYLRPQRALPFGWGPRVVRPGSGARRRRDRPLLGVGWVWFWKQADTFREYVLDIVQGLFWPAWPAWPAWMVYEVFEALAR